MRRFGLFLLIFAILANTLGTGITGSHVAAAITATTTDDLNLRSGPGTSYGVLTVIPRGSSVTLTGETSNGFRAVTYKGQNGWASSDYLRVGSGEPVPAGTATTTDDLNLRTGPGTSYAVIAVMPKGSTVTLTGDTSNEFRAVTYKGQLGWAANGYLSLKDIPTPPPASGTTGAATTTDSLNLRSGPDTSYSVLSVMPPGSRVTLTGQSSNGFRSLSYQGINGWAASEYLDINAAPPAPPPPPAEVSATTTDDLNLRSGPSTSNGVLTIMPRGSSVTVTDEDTNGFYAVTYQGWSGWASADFLDFGTATPPMYVPVTNFDITNALVGPSRGSADRAMTFATAAGAKRVTDVNRYIIEIYRLAPEIGLDPALLVAQSAHETGNWTSSWWQNRLNPAGLGITGDPAQNAASPTFANGTMAARAHIAHMHAEVFGSSRPLPTVLQGADPTYQRVFDAGWAGDVRTLQDLVGTWAVDAAYDTKLVRKGREIFG